MKSALRITLHSPLSLGELLYDQTGNSQVLEIELTKQTTVAWN